MKMLRTLQYSGLVVRLLFYPLSSFLYVWNHCPIYTFISSIIIIIITNLGGAEDKTQVLSLMLDKCSITELDPQL